MRQSGGVPPTFRIRTRVRPVDLVAPVGPAAHVGYGDHAPPRAEYPLPGAAPYVAVQAWLRDDPVGRLDLVLASGDVALTGRWDGTALSLLVDDGRRSTRHRSRRHGRPDPPVVGVALTLTGPHLTAWSHDGTTWTARGRVALTDRVPVHDEDFLAGLVARHAWSPPRGPVAEDPGPNPVTGVAAGGFGQVGLRDVRFATHADGTAYRLGERFVLTATHAGPGFADAGHTGVWLLDPATHAVAHVADLYFRRPDVPGVYGDHATHLVRDGEEWLVATSTWGDFDPSAPPGTLGVTLARSGDDLLTGRHVLDTERLPLPVADLRRSVGTWDPHLVRIPDAAGGTWHVGFVNATRFFRFHPALAAGPSLDDLSLRAADRSRTATEGTTLARWDGQWRVLASDGRGGPRGRRARFPVLDLDLAQVGELDAPYPTNIPWPTIAPYDGGWLWVTFDGTPLVRGGGGLLGYGTHGDLLVGGAPGPQG